jgi:hypothetical protein
LIEKAAFAPGGFFSSVLWMGGTLSRELFNTCVQKAVQNPKTIFATDF